MIDKERVPVRPLEGRRREMTREELTSQTIPSQRQQSTDRDQLRRGWGGATDMLRDQRESRSSGLQVVAEETTKKQNKTRTVKRGITNWTTTIHGRVFLIGAIAK